ncbi:MAG: hypothetical protein KDB95_05240 [Flavobacteriales bacterium]|nr:hypothetical protein [Flavobacteriales bacterium]
MRLVALSLVLSASLLGYVPGGPEVDREEARSAFELVNLIRKDPKAYSQRLKFSPIQVVARPALRWNDTLALAAERKALDMARRNYYAHVDPDGFGMNHYIQLAGYELDPRWLKNPEENNFESIHSGIADAVQLIEEMIIDAQVPSKGHRHHLLGVGEWNASLVDIGIGFVHADSTADWPTYACVLIAKHK